jgi:hypothetical protein
MTIPRCFLIVQQKTGLGRRAFRREAMHESCRTTQRRVSLRLCQCNLFHGKDRLRMQMHPVCTRYYMVFPSWQTMHRNQLPISYSGHTRTPPTPSLVRNVAPLLSLVAQASWCRRRPGPFLRCHKRQIHVSLLLLLLFFGGSARYRNM